MDEFLQSYVKKYEQWRNDGDFSISSQVIPVNEALIGNQRILAIEQVMQIFKDSQIFALAECHCRVQYSRCNRPRETCLLIDDAAVRALELNKARRITLEEAKTVIKHANVYGLVLMTYYLPGKRINAICSCCPCCCHDLQLLLQYHRTDLVIGSDYIAETDADRCISCGICVERCVFRARTLQDSHFTYDPTLCLGCGLCVTVCPEQATSMQLHL